MVDDLFGDEKLPEIFIGDYENPFLPGHLTLTLNEEFSNDWSVDMPSCGACVCLPEVRCLATSGTIRHVAKIGQGMMSSYLTRAEI